MFTRLKVKLTLLFTLIVALLQLINVAIFIIHKNSDSPLLSHTVMTDVMWAIGEIVLTSFFIYIIGYFFVSLTIKPAEDMFSRLEQFAQDASHELKTPLSIASTSMDLALKTKNYNTYLNKAKHSLMKVNSIVDSLLTLARIDSLSLLKENIQVRDVCKKILDSYQDYIQEKKLTISLNIPDSLSMKADPDLFTILIGNLIENAIKFNITGGMIHIDGQTSHISITNTGSPIDEKLKELIFERFVKADTSRSTKGYGIGLSIVKKICDIHKWKITLKTTDSKNTFIIYYR